MRLTWAIPVMNGILKFAADGTFRGVTEKIQVREQQFRGMGEVNLVMFVCEA